ncbi:MAG: hypothetical protein CVV13_13570 [Gammaproteobacteria bacterium HGW-Gammaproteobacteria-3]|jgi:CheY-like chemotaxis protein|nr:MAG: hypothetical protein CVV13_13570 [Gammaproteobacteria bacterium HGW-Gammaproteobacteria-3]
MIQNELRSENPSHHNRSSVQIALSGFEAADEDKFMRFFQLTRPDRRKYIAANSANKQESDILMVNYDNPAALQEKAELLASHPHIQVVAVSRGPLAEATNHHIRGLLFAARVLTTLDKVSIPGHIEPNTDYPEEMPAPFVQTTGTATMPAAPINGYRALVVDDSSAIQKSLELNLATLPQIASIDFADNGESALEKAEMQQYDLIFLDVMMPGIDGYETCTHLRKKPAYKKTPIIMVSGKTSPLDEVKGVIAGCTTYLTKPVQAEAFQKLGTRVLTWLEQQKTP